MSDHPAIGSWTAIDVAAAVSAGELSAAEVLEEALRRIAAANDELDAFTFLDPERARRDAAAVDRRVAAGEHLPLAGVPLGVKELDRVEGWPDNAGTAIYADRVATRTDTHVRRLLDAGAVAVGLTSASEFGITAYTHHPARGVTARNPWDPDTSPGGSSGGSAGAVAAGLVPVATGGDGGGSIRLPAALSGLVGPKVSLGRVPRSARDLWPTAVLGPLATTVADAARFLDVVRGPDGHDRTELPPDPASWEAALGTVDHGMRAAIVTGFGHAAVDPGVLALVDDAAHALVDAAGLTLVDRPVQFRDPSSAWSAVGAAGSIRAFSDAGDVDESLLSREGRWSYRGSPRVTATDLAKAIDRAAAVCDEIEVAFDDVDLLLLPSCAVPSVPAEGPLPTEIDGREVRPAAMAQFTIPFNLSGHPGVSVPAGLVDGHPVGLQIVGRRFTEARLLALAARLEATRPWPRHAPGWPRPAARSTA
ncbi:MAG: amidase [Actinomycetota bacterium]